MEFLIVLTAAAMILSVLMVYRNDKRTVEFKDNCRERGGIVNTVGGEEENVNPGLLSDTLRFCDLPGGPALLQK